MIDKREANFYTNLTLLHCFGLRNSKHVKITMTIATTVYEMQWHSAVILLYLTCHEFRCMERLLVSNHSSVLIHYTFVEPYAGVSGQRMGSSTMRRYTPLNGTTGNIRKNGSITNRMVSSVALTELVKLCYSYSIL